MSKCQFCGLGPEACGCPVRVASETRTELPDSAQERQLENPPVGIGFSREQHDPGDEDREVVPSISTEKLRRMWLDIVNRGCNGVARGDCGLCDEIVVDPRCRHHSERAFLRHGGRPR